MTPRWCLQQDSDDVKEALASLKGISQVQVYSLKLTIIRLIASSVRLISRRAVYAIARDKKLAIARAAP